MTIYDPSNPITTWQTPKTNWNANDYFNIEDYDRIKYNLLVINDVALNLVNSLTLIPMETLSYESLYKPSTMNNIINNMNYIKNEFTKFGSIFYGYEYMRTYVAHKSGWNYNDLNIIEKNLQIMVDVISSISVFETKLPDKLGIDNTLGTDL